MRFSLLKLLDKSFEVTVIMYEQCITCLFDSGRKLYTFLIWNLYVITS